MIVLTHIDKYDRRAVRNILIDNGIDDDLNEGVIYVLKDKDKIMGAGKIATFDDYGILKYIVVDESFRGSNYGESILRGLLFKCKSMGVNKVYFSDHNDYLVSLGFIHNKKSSLKDYSLILEIDDFFNKSCCGDINEI